jgi:hypothetical protein
MYSVYQHWDSLKACIVGRTYPPEFYKFIQNTKTRISFETLAEETEEDYQQLISLLTKRFGVQVFRPEFPDDLDELFVNGKWVQPPTAPRDYFLMIQDRFWVPQVPNASHAWSVFYRQNKQSWWPDYVRPGDFYDALPEHAPEIQEKFEKFKANDQAHLDAKLKFYTHVFDHIQYINDNIRPHVRIYTRKHNHAHIHANTYMQKHSMHLTTHAHTFIGTYVYSQPVHVY